MPIIGITLAGRREAKLLTGNLGRAPIRAGEGLERGHGQANFFNAPPMTGRTADYLDGSAALNNARWFPAQSPRPQTAAE